MRCGARFAVEEKRDPHRYQVALKYKVSLRCSRTEP